MGTFTQTYCDLCNYEHEVDYARAAGEDGNDGDTWRRAYMPEAPCMGGLYGWATFAKPTERYRQMHVCAACLADPDVDLPRAPWEPQFDEDRENVAKGEAARERFQEVRERLGTYDARWDYWRGVRQVLGEVRCYLPRSKPAEAVG